ncbi:unnamed protein product [Periconia digitata]|uniref:Phosphodiesterase n=1 Tax=Periconia digitata TaxID=1303443 RepID=A0A9W4UJL2_9PLEO|nr:unnamed protein product [Periconia digitata]
MEHGACNVIYIDRRANDEYVRRETLSSSLAATTTTGNMNQGYFNLGKTTPPADIHANIETILSTFNQVHICGSGGSCLARISQILESAKSNVPTIVLIDIPYHEEQRLKRLSREPRTPSPTATRMMRLDSGEPDDIYGMHLLTHISSEIASRNFSKLVIPVVILSGLEREWASNSVPSPAVHGSQVLPDTPRLVRYLDAGAIDVLSSPLSKDSVHGLAVHAYRIHKEVSRDEASFLTTKRNRKLSWVGVDDTKPYAYLREAMVSSLMSGICNPELVGDSFDSNDLYVAEERKEAVARAVGTWSFSAHEFTDDELVYGALLMLKHALQIPELEQWSMTDDEMIVFLLASRTAYNEFVLYHNFRHVVDVLQALFHFLVQIGTLPSYPAGVQRNEAVPDSPIARLLKPLDGLTLLISAVGHDVGHPGVNNAFLVALNAPLAQLYNDRSVLESFHCAAYSQILRRYWPKVFADAGMRKLMINSILATDMGLHFKYMSDLGNLQEKIAHDNGLTDGWSVKVCEENKDLTCGLLIKCADISNVARKFETAARWANILTDEFSNQGVMEQELQMPSCLFGGPPVQDDLIKLGESQIGFMNIFARPLFEAVADILPAMGYAVNEIVTNSSVWEKKIEGEKEKKRKNPRLSLGLLSASFSADPTPSPFSGGPLKQPVDASALPPQVGRSIQPSHVVSMENADRRGSGSSFHGFSGSRRSSTGVDKGSRRSSGVGLPGGRSRENQNQSRRESGDASLTAILVTQTTNAPDTSTTAQNSEARSSSPEHQKESSSRSSSTPRKDNNGLRPVTAPSHARQHQASSLFPAPRVPSQRHSEIDLQQAANGNLDGSRMQHWDSNNKMSGDSTMSRSDGTRDMTRKPDWWRQMSARRRTKDMRNGDREHHPHPSHKEAALNPTRSNSNSETTTPSATTSPGRSSRTDKLKSFFKRKPRTSNDQEKQLSSFGSSSQMRTPPTSDPGRSLNSDE